MPFSLLWPRTTAPQPLLPGQIHVWAWALCSGQDGEWTWAAAARERVALDEEELRRAERLHFERDRRRFVRAHATLRRILGAYAGAPPHTLAFVSNSFGKPRLSLRQPAPDLRFNLSHSGEIALLAVSLGIEVGVDVEWVQPIEPEVARESFSAREIQALDSLQTPAAAQGGEAWLQGFYNCWTRKEAILKAEGAGLNIPLHAFDVSLLPGDGAALLAVRPPAAFQHPWALLALSPVAGAAATLAYAAPAAKVECFQFAGFLGGL